QPSLLGRRRAKPQARDRSGAPARGGRAGEESRLRPARRRPRARLRLRVVPARELPAPRRREERLARALAPDRLDGSLREAGPRSLAQLSQRYCHGGTEARSYACLVRALATSTTP